MYNFHQNNQPKKHKSKHLRNFHLDNMLKNVYLDNKLKKLLPRQYI